MPFTLNPFRILAGLGVLAVGLVGFAALSVAFVASRVSAFVVWVLSSPVLFVVWNIVAIGGLAVADHYGHLPLPPAWMGFSQVRKVADSAVKNESCPCSAEGAGRSGPSTSSEARP